ncbi:MAG: phospholipase D family protein [Candidatus Margulisiibacteriota bacterium]
MSNRLISLIFTAILSISISQASFGSIQTYFSPNGGCSSAIIKEIGKAVNTIDIAMYSFTSRPIVQELERAGARGVKIRVLLDKGQETQKYSKSRYLAQKGFEVKFDTGSGLMHNKVGIIDGKILITGSFNWTAQAETRNAENLLIIDDPNIISKFQSKFNELWDRGRVANS